jgi:hypothetical protein
MTSATQRRRAFSQTSSGAATEHDAARDDLRRIVREEFRGLLRSVLTALDGPDGYSSRRGHGPESIGYGLDRLGQELTLLWSSGGQRRREHQKHRRFHACTLSRLIGASTRCSATRAWLTRRRRIPLAVGVAQSHGESLAGDSRERRWAMALFRVPGWGVVAVGLVACSGASSSGAPSGGDGSTGDDGSSSGGTGSGATSSSGTSSGAASSGGSTSSSGAGSSGASSSGSGSGGLSSSGGPGDASADAPTDAPAACPDLGGFYSITPVQGLGCGSGFNASASECIHQQACDISIIVMVTPPDGGFNIGITGLATLASDGSFTSAALREGTLNRTGCTGTWDSGSGTLTVDCGGVDSGQACLVTLTRTSSIACP